MNGDSADQVGYFHKEREENERGWRKKCVCYREVEEDIVGLQRANRI